MYNYLDVGEWRSLVARMVWDHEAAGSSPVSPTNMVTAKPALIE